MVFSEKTFKNYISNLPSSRYLLELEKLLLFLGYSKTEKKNY